MKERKEFRKSGMNLDKDPRTFDVNDYGYALNCLTNNSNASNEGSIENRKGNTLINFDLPIGTNKVIGACKDINRNAIVYMVFNSQNNHCILRYNISTQTIDKILYAEAQLNFHDDWIISSINIIGDLLYWTYGYFDKFTFDPTAGEFKDMWFNPPRKINMVKAYNMTNGVAVNDLYKYSSIDEQVLDRIKYPPNNKIKTAYNTDNTNNTNLLIGNLYQFAYRWIYDDNEKSVLSPYSLISLPTNSETWVCKWDTDYKKNNVIELWFNTGHEIVKQIELFFRTGNTGDWYSFDIIDKYTDTGDRIINDNSIYDYTISNGKGFYNNTQLTATDQVDAARLFDYVGQTVDSQTLISDNRIIDGSIVENYDNIDIDVSFTRKEKELHFLTQPSDPQPIYIIYSHNGYSVISIYGILFANQFGLFYPNTTYEIIFTIHLADGSDDILSATYTTGANGTFTQQDITNSWVSQINTQAASMYSPQRFGIYNDNLAYGDIYFGASGYYGYAYNYDVVIRLQQVFTIPSTDIHPIVSSFKSGHKHHFGIVYYDRAGRSSGVNKKENSSVYVPVDIEYLPHNATYPGGYFLDDMKIYNQIEWQINHKPPEWATHYQFVRLNNTPEFIQYFYVFAKINGDGNIEIDLNSKIQDFNDKVPKSILKEYSYTKGDRIRFLYYGYFTQMYYNTFADYIDIEISGVDSTSGNIIIEDIGFAQYKLNCDPATNPNRYSDFICVEIYTPNKTTESGTYVEFGEEFGISAAHTPNRAHQGQTQNQTTTQPAMGVFVNGDVYVKNRYAVAPTFLPVEVKNYSDIYTSDVINIGRVNAYIPNMKRQKYTNMRYSGQYLEDTRINNLSRFDFLNQKNVSNEFGDITSLNQVGYTLKVLQKNKNTSFDVGIQQLTGGGGDNITVVSSTEILGSPRPSMLGFGCQNPESVCVNDRYQYWWDQNYGVFLRDSANGMTIISDLGVKSFFARMKQECNDAITYKVITSFNKKNDEIIVSFITVSRNTNLQQQHVNTPLPAIVKIETIVFNEEENLWTTFLSYEKSGVPIDYMSALGDTLVTFLNGQLYLEDSNPLFGNMFGEQKQMIVDVVGNADGEKVKVFYALGLTTNLNKIISGSLGNWHCESVTIPATGVNPLGGYTIIPASKFRMKEEALYADIPRNINTPMSGSQQYKMLNGSPMRGQVATFRLVNESNSAVVLYSVIIKSTPSELSK